MLIAQRRRGRAALLVAVAALPAGAPLAGPGRARGGDRARDAAGRRLRAHAAAGLLPDAGAVRAAFAVEASAVELTWVFGPPLALGLGALWSTGAALAGAGRGAARRDGRVRRAARLARLAAGGGRAAAARRLAAARPAMRTLVLVLVAVGVLFGAAEIGVDRRRRARSAADRRGRPAARRVGRGLAARAACWPRAVGGAPAPLVPLLGALAAGHLALAAAAGSVVALAAVLFVAGAAIAPTYAAVYALVDAPRRPAR